MQNSTLAVTEFLMHTESKTAQEGLDLRFKNFRFFFREDSCILSQTQISSDTKLVPHSRHPAQVQLPAQQQNPHWFYSVKWFWGDSGLQSGTASPRYFITADLSSRTEPTTTPKRAAFPRPAPCSPQKEWDRALERSFLNMEQHKSTSENQRCISFPPAALTLAEKPVLFQRAGGGSIGLACPTSRSLNPTEHRKSTKTFSRDPNIEWITGWHFRKKYETLKISIWKCGCSETSWIV